MPTSNHWTTGRFLGKSADNPLTLNKWAHVLERTEEFYTDFWHGVIDKNVDDVAKEYPELMLGG